MKKFAQEEILYKIRAHIRINYSSAAAAARKWGIEPGALYEMLKGNVKPYDWLLKEIGFERHQPDEFYTRIKR